MNATTSYAKNPRPGTIIANVDAYLAQGRTLTPAEAFVTFKTMRLASAIEELRNKYGRSIKTTIKTNPGTEVEYASYSLWTPKKGDKVEVISVEHTQDAWGYSREFFGIGDVGVITEVHRDGAIVVQFSGSSSRFLLSHRDLKPI